MRFLPMALRRDVDKYRRSFYRYFDLSNEQLFYANRGRVSAETRQQWEDGIANNLSRPAFQAAWLGLLTISTTRPLRIFGDSAGPGAYQARLTMRTVMCPPWVG